MYIFLQCKYYMDCTEGGKNIKKKEENLEVCIYILD